MASHEKPARLIELRVRDIHQLFNSLDPSPFREKDIDRDAEEFIVSWSHDIPLDEPLLLRVHLEHHPGEDPGALLSEAVRNYFTGRSENAQRQFRYLMRQGRMALLIGVVFLAVCLAGGELMARQGTAWATYLRESLTIAGWVAMWRPMQIYLYEWWPLRREVANYARLAAMRVEVVTPGA